MERAVIMSDSNILQPQDFFLNQQGEEEKKSRNAHQFQP
jgi:hypothetical protein